ncbi:MAG: class I SAM-dependent methyltransferase [Sumerlaeia bacterium]
MCTACTVNTDKAEAFAGQMLSVLNHGSIALMISVAHRTGLFDTMANLSHSTSAEIAEAARLNERYVREALGCFVTAGIVDYEPLSKTYRLPAEHAAYLTRAAGPNNFASPMQFFAVLGGVEDEIVRCFREGGGVPYERYARFHPVMAEESSQTVGSALTEHILPLVPGLVRDLERGVRLLDVGCGSGLTLCRLAELFPASHFTGYDLCEEAVERARATAEARGLTNIEFAERNAAAWDEEDAFDVITAFDAIHDQARPDLVLANIRRALKPGGTFLMQDIRASSHLENNLDHPVAPFIYAISCLHCMSVSLAQGGMGLGAAWGKELAVEMLEDAGFLGTEVHELEHDIQNYWYVSTK